MLPIVDPDLRNIQFNCRHAEAMSLGVIVTKTPKRPITMRQPLMFDLGVQS